MVYREVDRLAVPTQHGPAIPNIRDHYILANNQHNHSRTPRENAFIVEILLVEFKISVDEGVDHGLFDEIAEVLLIVEIILFQQNFP